MEIEKLELANYRGIYRTELSFSPGFNLIVGPNGVGKTAIIDALRMMIAKVLPQFTYAPNYNIGIEGSDIMHGYDSVSASMSFSCHVTSYVCTVHKSTKKWMNSIKGEFVVETPDKLQLTPDPPKIDESRKKSPQPICVFFSTRRAWASDDKSKSADGPKAAYYRSLASDRGLRVRDLTAWWKSKEAIAEEAPHGKSAKQLQSVRTVLEQLLPDFSDWERDGDEVTVRKKVVYNVLEEERTTVYPLRISQLSEGEKSLISFAFDLTRRLSQANPESENPAQDGTGVVIIDEVDLHLHPAWQRAITHTLTSVFPKLQFIATTHSPQIVGEILPNNVILLSSGGEVVPVSESLGRDSGWILRHLMDTDERTKPMVEGLKEVVRLISQGNLVEAREKVTQLRFTYGPDPSLISADTTIDRRLLFNK